MSILENEPTHRGRTSPGSNYDKEFIDEVVQAVNEGLSIKTACRRYNVPTGTIKNWMRDYGSAAYKEHRRPLVPAQTKRSIVRAIEEGRMTIREAKIAYNLKAGRTIQKWVKAFKQENTELAASNKDGLTKKKPQKSRVYTAEEMQAVQQQLAEEKLRTAALNTLIDVAEEQLKINIRKKPGAKQ